MAVSTVHVNYPGGENHEVAKNLKIDYLLYMSSSTCTPFLVSLSTVRTSVSYAKWQQEHSHIAIIITLWYVHDQSRDPPEHIFQEAHAMVCKTEDKQDHHLGMGINEVTTLTGRLL